MQAPHIPKEIINEIFSYIDSQHDLRSVALVCWEWHACVLRFLYRNPKIRTPSKYIMACKENRLIAESIWLPDHNQCNSGCMLSKKALLWARFGSHLTSIKFHSFPDCTRAQYITAIAPHVKNTLRQFHHYHCDAETLSETVHILSQCSRLVDVRLQFKCSPQPLVGLFQKRWACADTLTNLELRCESGPTIRYAPWPESKSRAICRAIASMSKLHSLALIFVIPAKKEPLKDLAALSNLRCLALWLYEIPDFALEAILEGCPELNWVSMERTTREENLERLCKRKGLSPCWGTSWSRMRIEMENLTKGWVVV